MSLSPSPGPSVGRRLDAASEGGSGVSCSVSARVSSGSGSWGLPAAALPKHGSRGTPLFVRDGPLIETRETLPISISEGRPAAVLAVWDSREFSPSRRCIRHDERPGCMSLDDIKPAVPLARWPLRLAKSPKRVAGQRGKTRRSTPRQSRLESNARGIQTG